MRATPEDLVLITGGWAQKPVADQLPFLAVEWAVGYEGIFAPFCAFESCWIRHLDTAHRDVVARLAARLPARLRRGDVRPLGVDRYGVRLRVESAGDTEQRAPHARLICAEHAASRENQRSPFTLQG